jgi:methionyl-tRNA formyltransferase
MTKIQTNNNAASPQCKSEAVPGTTRVIFAASDKIAIPAFQKMLELSQNPPRNGPSLEICGIITAPEAPKGRKSDLSPNEFAKFIGELQKEGKLNANFRIYEPFSLDKEAENEISGQKPDLLVCFAYGKLFSEHFLQIFKYGGINIHPSLLPKWRGPSPIQAAIIQREASTGVCIQRLAAKMDSGMIFARSEIPLDGAETGASLSAAASQKAAELLAEFFSRFPEILETGTPQDEAAASYCRLLKSADGELDWRKSAGEIDAQIRAYTPWPPCYSFRDGKKLFLLEGHFVEAARLCAPPEKAPGTVLGSDKNHGILIQCGEGLYAATRLQAEAKKALDWKAFLNGARNFTGSRLGNY